MDLAAFILAWFGLLAAQSSSSPQPASASQRVEVPIEEVLLSDGKRGYGVPVLIGTARIEAALDTGSTGLRVLPTGLEHGDARPTQATDYIEYGGGVRLDGSVANATIAIGALSGTTTVQLVQRASCTDLAPACEAAAVPLARYHMFGNGKPGNGFGAILGINMADPSHTGDVGNPLRGIGARRWIIELPRPGEPSSGRLVLNPTDAEVAAYTRVEIVGDATVHGLLHDAVRGCLVNETSHEKVCGAVALDTGDLGLRVARKDAPTEAWPDGTPVTLFFADAAAQVHIAERATVNSADRATRFVSENKPGAAQPFILTGVLAYLAYSVLYDPEHQTIGFKERPAVAGAPRPFRIN